MKKINKTLVFLAIFVAAIVVSLLTTVSSNPVANPVKILPLGDSITVGFGDGNIPPEVLGYRGFLGENLEAENIDFEFVGSKINGGLKHEGTAGIKIHGILTNQAWKNFNPDIILLLVGANDLRAGQDPVYVGFELIDLYSKIIEDLPSIDLYVASILPVDTTGNWFINHPKNKIGLNNQIIDKFNSGLEASIKNMDLDNLIFVDINSPIYTEDLNALNPSGQNQADGLHPNVNAYQKIAEEWKKQIISHLKSS